MAEMNEKELNEVAGGKSNNGKGWGNSPYFSYTIVYGDTLSGIALRFGTTVQNLCVLNNIPNADKIKSGQVIIVPRN